ncbi:UNVERIFIED_CONTAM: diacylglycerol kinase family lipid kinase [Streptococcus canis]|uniref:diacylglycerol/lipid kinase family protein n=2 Tax=Streptococcus canis TaxID=1329 RepID=UPI001141577B|nr:diacylglycerol kinase family protein [Streptococcus canis]MDV6000559.1 diacylglycerol kinase family lipid kinase [Streptococcus canis]MDV6022223.1 diacylglycerol kinase family lipid kinase [Streptococcus canis]GEE05942.1 diacylglycerol kinase [Streptococcus canis]
MKKALLIVNPASGGEKAKEYETKMHHKLAQYFDNVIIRHTKESGDAKVFAHEASEQHYHSVFVMGGDGTVNEAINGISGHAERPYFGFLPLGTVNDLARALDIPLDPEEAIDSLDLDNPRALDVGQVNDDYFMNIVAIGNIPESINNVDDKAKTALGPLAYFLSGLKQVVTNRSHTFQVTRDGKEDQLKSSLILVGLTNSIGGFDQMTANAKVDDGYLHLVYIKDHNFFETLAALPSLFSAETEGSDQLGYERVKEVKIDLEGEKLTSNVDGDEGDDLPLTIKVLPSHLQVYTSHTKSADATI